VFQPVLRYGRGIVFGVVLVVGATASVYFPKAAIAQTVTCWREACEGDVCVRIKIPCPPTNEP
jgi:hypothetical protein